jgi:hypothetical protein
MRAEYSELNNSKMIELDFLRLMNLDLSAAKEIDRVVAPTIFRYNKGVIDCNFESSSMVLTPVRHWLDQISNSNAMKFSRISDRRKAVDEKGKFRLKNGIDSDSVGMTFQW